MARIGNEARLIIKLARERKVHSSHNEPYAIREDKKLHEAYMMGLVDGQRAYEACLDDIVAEIEQRG